MQYKMTLSGRYVVTGEDAKMLWSLVLANGLANGTIWANLIDAKDEGQIIISLRTISAKFEFNGLTRDEFSSLVTYLTEEKTAITGAANEVYLKMLETARHGTKEA